MNIYPKFLQADPSSLVDPVNDGDEAAVDFRGFYASFTDRDEPVHFASVNFKELQRPVQEFTAIDLESPPSANSDVLTNSDDGQTPLSIAATGPSLSRPDADASIRLRGVQSETIDNILTPHGGHDVRSDNRAADKAAQDRNTIRPGTPLNATPVETPETHPIFAKPEVNNPSELQKLGTPNGTRGSELLMPSVPHREFLATSAEDGRGSTPGINLRPNISYRNRQSGAPAILSTGDVSEPRQEPVSPQGPGPVSKTVSGPKSLSASGPVSPPLSLVAEGMPPGSNGGQGSLAITDNIPVNSDNDPLPVLTRDTKINANARTVNPPSTVTDRVVQRTSGDPEPMQRLEPQDLPSNRDLNLTREPTIARPREPIAAPTERIKELPTPTVSDKAQKNASPVSFQYEIKGSQAMANGAAEGLGDKLSQPEIVAKKTEFVINNQAETPAGKMQRLAHAPAAKIAEVDQNPILKSDEIIQSGLTSLPETMPAKGRPSTVQQSVLPARAEIPETVEIPARDVPPDSHRIMAAASAEAGDEYFKSMAKLPPIGEASVMPDLSIQTSPMFPTNTDGALKAVQTVTLATPHTSSHPAIQTVAQMLVKTQETQNGVMVRLDPPEMGRVYIDFHFETERGLTAVIRSEIAETGIMLKDKADFFHQTLKEHGFDAVNLSFEQNGDSKQKAFDFDRHENPELLLTAEAEEEVMNPDMPQILAPPYQLPSGQQIDVKL